jgi:hypothetical protein
LKVLFIWVADIACSEGIFIDLNKFKKFCLSCNITFNERNNYNDIYESRSELPNILNFYKEFTLWCNLHSKQRSLEKVIDESIRKNNFRVIAFNKGI